MKNTKNRSKFFMKTLSIPALIVIFTLALTISRGEVSSTSEVQTQPESINSTMLPQIPAETTPFVTTTPTIATNAPDRDIQGNGYSFYRDSEADMLNIALFGITEGEWKATNFN